MHVRRTVMRLAAATLLLAASALTLQASAQSSGPRLGVDWGMNGRDPGASHHQPAERTIGPANAARLKPKWTLQTAGDVSAIAAVVGGAVYVPDWGGKLWKIDAETGEVVWSRSVSDYNGIPGSVSRTSPVVAHGMVYVGDLNGGAMMAVDAETGDLRWKTQLDTHPSTIVTNSPVVVGNRLLIGTSRRAVAGAPNTFRGSLLALDAHTGAIQWQTYMVPEGYAGGSLVNSPAVDLADQLVVVGAGDLRVRPASVTACLAAAPGGWDEACYPAGVFFSSVVALDLRTGEPRWSYRGAGADAWQAACGGLPAWITWCPGPTSFVEYDFAGSGAQVFRARIDGRPRLVVGIGQKSGVYWALDAGTGDLLWTSLVGPGSEQGGIQWGTATDSERIYAPIGNLDRESYTLRPAGGTATAGSWAAIDPSTGDHLWQTPDPQNALDYGAMTVANGVVYAGSMAQTGNQMYALDAATGTILWSFPAGGSVVSAPAIVDGALYWGSGYGRVGGKANNVFYAFTIDGA